MQTKLEGRLFWLNNYGNQEEQINEGVQLLEKSGLDYTTLRLPWLNNRQEIKYSITHRYDKFVGLSGSRQSIADAVLKIVAAPTYGNRGSPGIADPDTDGLTRPV